MAAFTPVVYSTQAAKMVTATEDRIVEDKELGGRLRVALFDFSVTAASDAEGLVFTKLPPCTIVGGRFITTNSDASGEINIGVTPVSSLVDTNVAALTSALDISTDGIFNLLNAVAVYEITVESYLIANTITTGFDASWTLNGYVEYAIG